MSDQPKVIVDRRAPQPPPPPPSVDAEAGMKVALTVLALAALPISAWLYISSYIEERVDASISRQDQFTQQTFAQYESSIASLQNYVAQLCTEARESDPSFSCASGLRYSFPANQ